MLRRISLFGKRYKNTLRIPSSESATQIHGWDSFHAQMILELWPSSCNMPFLLALITTAPLQVCANPTSNCFQAAWFPFSSKYPTACNLNLRCTSCTSQAATRLQQWNWNFLKYGWTSCNYVILPVRKNCKDNSNFSSFNIELLGITTNGAQSCVIFCHA